MEWRRPAVGEEKPASSCQDQFATLVPPFVPLLLRVAAALIGPGDAEDAAQEAILRAWQHWGELRDANAVRPWLLQITVNICRQWHRGRFGTHRRRTESLASADLLAAPLLAGDLNAADYTAALDLRQALENLPQHLRLIVALRYFGGMDATEIGLALKMPPETVRTRLRRALSILRTALRTSGETPTVNAQERSQHV